MYLRRFSLVIAVVCASLSFTQNVEAVVLASDDFNAEGSGTGWEAASNWDGGVAGGVASWGEVNRNFSAPIDVESHDKVYIAFDFTKTMGVGNDWGGLAFFEGLDGAGDETFFVGEPGAFASYGVDLKEGSNLDSGMAVDNATHRLIAEIDINAGASNDSVRFWIDSNDFLTPTVASAVFNSPYDAPWSSLRLAGSTDYTTDNLIIATTAAEVGLVPEPTSVVLLLGFLSVAAGVRQRRFS